MVRFVGKKIAYITASVIQIILLIGAVVLDVLTRRFMGMARFMVARSQQLQQNFPIDVFLWVCAGILIALAFVAIALFLQRAAGRNFRTWAMMVILVVLTLVFIVFISAYDTTVMRAYYAVAVLLGITGYIQAIKAIVNEILYRKGALGKSGPTDAAPQFE